MSHKTHKKRVRGEASTSTAEDPGEGERAQNSPMEIAEPDEPDPPPHRRHRDRSSRNKLEKRNKKYSKHRATVECRPKKNEFQYECMNCVKRLDDTVRKVHGDLLASRLKMVGVTLTQKVETTTHNRRVQTSPERVQPVKEQIQPVPKQIKPKRMQHIAEEMGPMPAYMQTATEERNAVREQMHYIPAWMQTATEERNAVREWMHYMPAWMQTATGERNAVREQRHYMPAWMQTATEESSAVKEQMHYMPGWMQTATEERNVVREQMHFMPEKMQPDLEQVHTLPEPLDRMLKEMRAMSERMVPDTEPMHHAPEKMHHVSEQMQHVPDRVETRPECDDSQDNILTRDFSCGTDPCQLGEVCQCHKCLVKHNADANARAPETTSGNHVSRIHLNRALAPCQDVVLTDLYQHVLAGNENTPGSMYVSILADLHDQGPCEVPCKLRSDIVWMHDHIPTQAGTQTDLAGDDGVRDQCTQTNLARSIGIQKGNALAQIVGARLSHLKSASIQINMPELSPINKPVGRVLPAVIRN